MKHRGGNTILWIIGLFMLFLGAGCQQSQPEAFSQDLFAMDTYITYQVLAEDSVVGEAGLERVKQAFLEIDRLTDRFDEKSDVAQINQMAGIAAVKTSPEVIAIVETALEWSDHTDGAFNILIGSAIDLWGFGTETPRVPSEEEMEVAINQSNYHKIVVDKVQSTIFLPEKGMVMDLGGVAKGYATDQAVDGLRELGIENAIINAGGNVYAMGNRADGDPWKIGVQDPLDPQGITAVLQVRDMALVSSGDYQRYFEQGGIRYHHILDPSTGYPARASASSTVIMESATVADILSTALFVQGPVEGIALAETFSQVKAVMIIAGDGRVFKTANMNDYLLQP